ncbi:hypothetical protein [Natrinema sp. CGMCC1.2065]|uniref:hypothetical protein n=1 Tax=Natrinema sp. CGMCC1.2065 TaxID=3445767 RepID=UPI003F4A06DB
MGITITAYFTEFDHEVTVIDIDEEIVTPLNDGRAPITESELDELLATHVGIALRQRPPTTLFPTPTSGSWRSAHRGTKMAALIS